MKKIAIVDDDESILESVSLILEEYGYSVNTYIDGVGAYNKIRKIKPDLVLLDILLSGSDGREICKKLKKDPRTKNIPVVFISAQSSLINTKIECKADDFLQKPFQISELLSTIEKFTGHNGNKIN